jgi:Family of unknown function (DUF6246)
VLVECGFVRAQAPDGTEYTFRPSFGRIAALGSPQEIVALFAGLHGLQAQSQAAYVLAGMCDQDDPSPLIGWHEEFKGPDGRPRLRWCEGAMPAAEMVIIAQHLMRHGIVGKEKPGQGDGKFCDRFDAAEYVSAGRVHLGLSSEDAEALSMTEFQTMLKMKFPKSGDQKRDVPTREEYDAQMAGYMGRKRG